MEALRRRGDLARVLVAVDSNILARQWAGELAKYLPTVPSFEANAGSNVFHAFQRAEGPAIWVTTYAMLPAACSSGRSRARSRIWSSVGVSSGLGMSEDCPDGRVDYSRRRAGEYEQLAVGMADRLATPATVDRLHRETCRRERGPNLLLGPEPQRDRAGGLISVGEDVVQGAKHHGAVVVRFAYVGRSRPLRHRGQDWRFQ